MEIILNGKSVQTACRSLRQFITPDEQMVVIYNGFQTEADLPLQEGDSIVLIPKGRMVD